MTKPFTVLAIMVLAASRNMAVAGDPEPAPTRDRLAIGNRHYIRSQIPAIRSQPDGNTHEIYLSAFGDLCAQASQYTVRFGDTYLLWSTYSSFGEPNFEVRLDPGRDIGGLLIACAYDESMNIVCWKRRPDIDELWMRFFSHSGQPMGPSVLVTESAGTNQGPRPAILPIFGQDALWIVINSGHNSGNAEYDVLCRRYSIEGAPESEWIPVSNAPFPRTELAHSAAVLEDGSLVIGYVAGQWNYVKQPAIRRITAELSVGPEILLTDRFQDCNRMYMQSLDDGEVLACWHESAGTGSFVRRLDSSGQPIADSVPIDPLARYFVANRQGTLLAGVSVFPTIFLIMYDRNGVPLTEMFTPVPDPPPLPSQRFLGWQPLAMTDNGEFFVGFNAWDSQSGQQDAYFIAMQPYIPGDMNRDGLVNNFDIDAFVFALSNLPDYAATYNIPEDAAVIIGDINEDGVLNNFDIDPFVLLLVGE
ncbi:MAG: hypothetical protein JNG88_01380 [Phycisphaerales bacterium]|nr:hypothetical protein [Phycisphaerales bacterium]